MSINHARVGTISAGLPKCIEDCPVRILGHYTATVGHMSELSMLMIVTETYNIKIEAVEPNCWLLKVPENGEAENILYWKHREWL